MGQRISSERVVLTILHLCKSLMRCSGAVCWPFKDVFDMIPILIIPELSS